MASSSDYQERMRKRFHEAGVERQALMDKMKPAWQQHKALVEQIQHLQAQANDINAQQLRPIRDQLAGLEIERGRIARFLADPDGKSRMGKPEEYLAPEEIAAAQARHA